MTNGAEAVQIWAALFIAGFLGHLLGDYVVQTNWMAQNKAKPLFNGTDMAFTAITLHAESWALAVFTCMALVARTAWGLAVLPLLVVVCFILGAIHWIQDRRWPVKWLMRVTGHDPECTWLLIVFDNTLHLVQIALAAAWIVWRMAA